MKRTLSIIQMMIATALLASCSTHGRAPDTFYQASNAPYRLGSGDRIRVTVFGQQDLSNAYNIDQSGRIAFPLIGAVPVQGQTTQAAEAQIARKLRQGYLRNPDVSVEVVNYRAIFVMGEVNAPGQYSFVPGMNARQAVAAAGGFLPCASQANVDVTRTIAGKKITARMPLADRVIPGDTIEIRRRLF